MLYPYALYGYYFLMWLTSSNPKPYNSCGNGSAMRISPVAWYYDEEEMIKACEAITSVTQMIYRARYGVTRVKKNLY